MGHLSSLANKYNANGYLSGVLAHDVGVDIETDNKVDVPLYAWYVRIFKFMPNIVLNAVRWKAEIPAPSTLSTSVPHRIS